MGFGRTRGPPLIALTPKTALAFLSELVITAAYVKASHSLIAAQRSGPELPVPWLCKKSMRKLRPQPGPLVASVQVWPIKGQLGGSHSVVKSHREQRPGRLAWVRGQWRLGQSTGPVAG